MILVERPCGIITSPGTTIVTVDRLLEHLTGSSFHIKGKTVHLLRTFGCLKSHLQVPIILHGNVFIKTVVNYLFSYEVS